MEKYEDLNGQKVNNNDTIEECRNKFYSKLCELRERARKTGLEKEFVAHVLRRGKFHPQKHIYHGPKSTNGLDRIVPCHGRGRDLCWGSHKGYREG